MTPAGFAAMTALLAAVAPLALILEGGYNLSATAAGVEVSQRRDPDPPPRHRRAHRDADLLSCHPLLLRLAGGCTVAWMDLSALICLDGFPSCQRARAVP